VELGAAAVGSERLGDGLLQGGAGAKGGHGPGRHREHGPGLEIAHLAGGSRTRVEGAEIRELDRLPPLQARCNFRQCSLQHLADQRWAELGLAGDLPREVCFVDDLHYH
jgi:hypothetical protein